MEKQTKLKKNHILDKCVYLFAKNGFRTNGIMRKEILSLLDSGYIDFENYDLEDNGYQLMKLINYCVLKKIAEDFKPLDTEFMKKYKSLIKNY